MPDHEYFMNIALEEARQSRDEVPVGAVIVRNGKIIARAHNERENAYLPFAHAEILAMQRACDTLQTRRLNDCTLYVTLEPCPLCAGGMILACLGQCIFGAYDSAQGCCGSIYTLPEDSHFYHTLPCIGGILENECKALLRQFFRAKR